MVDYLIVGLGLAGIAFCERLEEHGKTFIVINDDSQTSSNIAGGLYNPVILKRFSLAWKANEQLNLAQKFYKSLEDKLGVPLDHKVTVLRIFASVEEQNLWFEAADKQKLQPYLSTKLLLNNNPCLDAQYGFGEVLHTGRVDTKKLVKAYSRYLSKKKLLYEETFNFDDLKMGTSGVSYRSNNAKKIVFATGFGLKRNKYFNYLPLNGTKGELLTIKAPLLKEERVIKSSVFIIPVGNDLYRIGATYKWKDKSNEPTSEARSELLTKLETFLNCDYKIVNHVAGIRPTVADRRPLVGKHPVLDHIYILNGFGSRGVLIAPYASSQLYEYIEKGGSIDPEMDITRYEKAYIKV
ncbi:MAG: FAD-binding oxidoreductase [Eudoraea sp.]|uniref:NAD(P)/FAD-dependent oxidoreductase n=1 Tax=Eudoraea sp. TaxID=1979955 RepID=UPI00326722DA